MTALQLRPGLLGEKLASADLWYCHLKCRLYYSCASSYMCVCVCVHINKFIAGNKRRGSTFGKIIFLPQYMTVKIFIIIMYIKRVTLYHQYYLIWHYKK